MLPPYNETIPNMLRSAHPMPCPLCRKPSSPQHKPFCSERCQKLDLHQWLSGGYAVPALETPDDEPEMQDDAESEHG